MEWKNCVQERWTLALLGCSALLLSGCAGFEKPELSYYAPGTEAVVSELSYMKGYTRYCEPLQLPQQPALHWPSDLVVSQDGKTLYALSKEPSLFTYTSDAVPEGEDYRQPDLRRRYIYQLDLGKGTLDIVKHDGVPPLSCVLGTELEIDHQDRLYTVDQVNQKIYRLESDRSEALVIVDEESKNSFGMPSMERSITYYFGVPEILKVSSSRLFYTVSSNGDVGREIQIRVFDFATQISDLFLDIPVRIPFLSLIEEKIFTNFFPLWVQKKEKTLTIQGMDNQAYADLQKSFGHISDVVATEFQGEWLFYATDSEKHVVYRLVTSTAFEFKDFAVFAGTLGQSGLKDGNHTEARFFSPSGLHLDKAGNVYVADTENHALRKITPEGVVSTVYQERVAVN